MRLSRDWVAWGIAISIAVGVVVVSAWIGERNNSAYAAKDWELIPTLGTSKILVVLFPRAESADKQSFDQIMDSVCPRSAPCIVNFWTDRSRVPHAYPMRDEEIDAQVANYVRNPITGFERLMWNCRLRRANPASCF